MITVHQGNNVLFPQNLLLNSFGCVSKNASGTSNINWWTGLKSLRSTFKSTDTLKSQGRESETSRRLEAESGQSKSEIYNKTIPLRTL